MTPDGVAGLSRTGQSFTPGLDRKVTLKNEDKEYEMIDAMTFEDPWIDVDLSEYEGIDPSAPSQAAPGSDLKVQTLAARYAAGVSLWHDEDCHDHGLAIDRPVVDDDNAAPLEEFDTEETDEVDELEPALA